MASGPEGTEKEIVGAEMACVDAATAHAAAAACHLTVAEA
jgi:hypothetical protein